jgi:RNA polymerase sigma-70 factor (ECF subfamily)
VFGFNLADAVRRLRAGRRDAARELPLGPGDPEPAADHSTPSGRAGRAEERDRLASAVARLPADQRAAVELHHLHGLPLAAVAARMGRTQPAVAGLLFRGLKKLRELLPDG